MKNLEKICENEKISFNAIDSHCRCIAHIMNLAVQEILKQIKAGEAQTEDEILQNMDIEEVATTDIAIGEIIPKVNLRYTVIYYLNFKLIIIIIIIFLNI